MSSQFPKVFAATITTGSTFSSAINTQGGYLFVSVEIPSNTNAFATAGGSPLFINGSSDGVTFRRIFEIYTNTVATAFSIASSVSNAIVPLNAVNLQYLKLEVSGTVTGGGGAVGYKIICTDSL